MLMSSIQYTIIWLVFLLVHLDLERIHCASLATKTCPPSLSLKCSPEVSHSCSDDQDCEARYPGKGLTCCDDCGRRCVTLGTSVVKIKPTSTEKINGTNLVAKCPTNPPSIEFPPGPDQECQNDASCDAKYPGRSLKCCSDGCDFRCVPPIMGSNTQTYDVQGTCPNSSEIAECQRPADDECHDDTRCRELYPGLELKCCKDGCDFRCVPPLPVIDTKTTKSGSKAKQQTTLSATAKPVTKPTNIEKQHTTSSPTTKPVTTNPETTVTQQTTSSSKTRIYQCPNFPTPAECPPEPDNECNDDRKCSELHPGLGLMCCIDGCDLRCVPPLLVIDTKTDKPESNVTASPKSKILQCPIFPLPDECPLESDDECNDDQKCSELHPGLGFKCCKDGCDYRCVPPLPVIDTKTDKSGSKAKQQTTLSATTKPVTKPTSIEKQLTASSSSPTTKSVATNPETTVTQQMTPSSKTRIYECPIFPTPEECPLEPDDECNEDQKCSELHPGLGLMCCKDGCDYRCVPSLPVIDTKTDKPESNVTASPKFKIYECPKFPTPAECPPEPDDECNEDQKCSELHPGITLKCCKDGCDYRCIPPIVYEVDK
ncbi:uncharacterized protein LOC116308182 [Actinia tenebrosa]|uniref:Uncharacterized protein LOC116308182 n=1 Tax=Actinia tenebrosa TaxID=6105 RepID=A0A6P8J442_ACTTE|nr:uncharacterized protein LOC116308182 [Actinia tenebrosa]